MRFSPGCSCCGAPSPSVPSASPIPTVSDCAACGFTGISECWEFSIAGVTNDNGCSVDCLNWNQTYNLNRSASDAQCSYLASRDCGFLTETISNLTVSIFGGCISRAYQWFLYHDGVSTWKLEAVEFGFCQPTVRYEVSDTSFDCTGENVMYLRLENAGDCPSFPQSITLSPMAC